MIRSSDLGANVSGAFMRPTLTDFLQVAEADRLLLDLLLHVGPLEIGLIGVDAGRVVHAELPGSVGDSALALLLQMPGIQVVPERGRRRTPNVERAWRELADAEQLRATPGQAWRLEHVRAEIAELVDVEPSEAPLDAASEPDAELVAMIGALLDWAAADACLRADNERAHALLSLRERLCAPEIVCAANLERLHLRLLEDEIAASVVEVRQ